MIAISDSKNGETAHKNSSLLEDLKGYLFSVLYDLTAELKESFVERVVIEVIFYLEHLLLFFAPWVDFPFQHEIIGQFLGQIVQYYSIVPFSTESYDSYITVFYLFVGFDICIFLFLCLLHFLRSHKAHFVYEWILSITKAYFKWIFYPFYIPLFGNFPHFMLL